MLVIPERTKAQWWPVFNGMRVQSCAFTKPDYAFTKVNPPLLWRTIFAIVDGRREHRQSEELRVEAPKLGRWWWQVKSYRVVCCFTGCMFVIL